MEISVTHEAFVFLCSALCGGALFFVYDLFRLIRLNVGEGYWMVQLHDILFWLTALTITFFTVLYINNGSIRFYELLGAGLGAILYGLTLSAPILKLFNRILAFFSKIFKIFLKILLTPLVFMYNIMYRGVCCILLPLRRLWRRLFRRLHTSLRRAVRYAKKSRGKRNENSNG